MDATADKDDVLRRYLLGKSPADVQESIEGRLFSDDRIFWEHLCIVEDEIIDDYVNEQLNPQEVQGFEQRFLSTDERRRKLEFARLLRSYVDAESSRGAAGWRSLGRRVSAPAWAFAAAVTLVLLLPAAVWQFGPANSQRELSAWLTPGLVRDVGGQVARVRVPADRALVRLRLETEDEYPRYRATLYDAEGPEIWSHNGVDAAVVDGRRAVALVLPAILLDSRDYYVRLHGVSANGDLVLLNRYDFRVIKE
ncbi:MAG TPA: hypothetical protein VK886_01350 [Vicinamibacterales bacterium]|nr:hypothetical protein [Vicinamibacterales bacterium]